MKNIVIGYNSKTNEFEARLKNKTILKSQYINSEDQDISYVRFMKDLLRKCPNDLYSNSSSIDNFVFDNKNYEWSNEELIVNTKKLIKKNNKLVRKSDLGQITFTRKEDGRLYLSNKEHE